MAELLLTFDQAADLIAQHAHSARQLVDQSHWPHQQLPLSSALGHILAQPLLADRDQPPFYRSTRDGFALRSADLASHHGNLPVLGATPAGSAPATLPPNAAWEVLTGAPVPDGADAVLMLEYANFADGFIHAQKSSIPGENIVSQGAEARSGDLLLAPGYPLHAAELGLAAACGLTHLAVHPQPRVLILPTGDELVSVDQRPLTHQIRDSNTPLLEAAIRLAGGLPIPLPIARDSESELHRALTTAIELAQQHLHTAPVLLLITGGVSVGRFDFVRQILAQLNARLHISGVRMQPGKPLAFGELPLTASDALPFFGLPGNPVSVATTFELFAKPLLRAFAGSDDHTPRFLTAKLANARKSKPGLTRFLPARLTPAHSSSQPPSVELISWQGSGDLAALTRANCWAIIPDDREQLHSGEIIQILLRS